MHFVEVNHQLGLAIDTYLYVVKKFKGMKSVMMVKVTLHFSLYLIQITQYWTRGCAGAAQKVLQPNMSQSMRLIIYTKSMKK